MVKETINQLLAAHQNSDQKKLEQFINSLTCEYERLQDRIVYLERQLYGKKRENNLHDTATTIETLPIFDSHEEDEAQVCIQSNGEITIQQDAPPPRKKKAKKLERSTLPRRVVIHDLKDEEKFCDSCQKPVHKVGEEHATKVEMIPAQYVAVEHIQVNYVCRGCGQVKCNRKVPGAIPKAIAGNSMIAKVIVDKYVHHLPIYRQSRIFRQHGLVVCDQTIGLWTSQLAQSLELLKSALWKQVINAPYLQVDETPVLCVEQKKKCYMWSYAAFYQEKRPSFILFDFQMTRGSAAVNERLANFKGLLQTDGYAGYNALRTKPGIVGLGCGAHIRRKFVDVVNSVHGSGSGAEQVILYFKQLYEIESLCKELPFEERRIYRQNKAQPILDKLYQWLQTTTTKAPPKSTLAKAIYYALDEWSAWSNYIHHGQAEIDTNWVENQIRPFAVGRRNWLFVGNQLGGETSALLYSLTHSAKLNGLDPWHYLFYLAHHVHHLRKKLVTPESLLPHRVDPQRMQELAHQHLHHIAALFGFGCSNESTDLGLNQSG